MVAPIQQVVVPVDLAAPNGNPDGIRHIVAANDPASRIRRDHGAPGEKNQIGRLPPVQGEVDDSALVHYLRDRRVLHFDHRRVSGDVHLLAHGAELQRDVHLHLVTYLEDDPGLEVIIEARGAHLKTESANRQVGKHISAVRYPP